MTTAIELRIDGDEFVCDFGMIDAPRTAFHLTYSRACIHALEPLPRIMLFGKTSVLSYTFQPVVYTGHCWPSIIRRNGDFVTLAVDKIGATEHCANNPTTPLVAAGSWRYRLHQARWWDEDDIADDFLIGVWPD
jgi:hypothetical protein